MVVSAAYGQFQQVQHGYLLKCGAAAVAEQAHVAVCKDGQVARARMQTKQFALQHLADVNIRSVQAQPQLRHVAALVVPDVQVM
jgi:hypothetical protein